MNEYTAGPTIDVYDAQTFKRIRTVTFDADMSGLVIIPPTAPAVRQASSGANR